MGLCRSLRYSGEGDRGIWIKVESWTPVEAASLTFQQSQTRHRGNTESLVSKCSSSIRRPLCFLLALLERSTISEWSKHHGRTEKLHVSSISFNFLPTWTVHRFVFEDSPDLSDSLSLCPTCIDDSRIRLCVTVGPRGCL